MKKIFAALILIILLIIPAVVFGSGGYEISSYDVDIKISSDNVYEITETIVADFFVPKHGIFRNIPLRYEGQRVKVSDIQVNEQYTQSKSNGELVLKIGDPDITLAGKKEYIIKYTFNMGRDNNDGYDLFYFNIIGDGWDTTIRNVRFTIEFPGFFEKNNVQFNSGSFGSTSSANVSHRVVGMNIIGSVPVLGAHEGLTARVVLPESTFAGESDNDNSIYYLIAAWTISIILLLFAWYIWNTKGRDPFLYPSVRFDPPENMTPAEVGYVIDGVVDNKDIISLVFYWADKGYVDISESGKNEFLFIKIKEPLTENDFETYMFDRLFSYGRDGWVSTNDLKQKFYEDIPIIKTQVKDKFRKDKRIFEKKANVWSGVLFILSIIPSLLMLFTIAEEVPSFELIMPAVFMFFAVYISGGVIVYILRKWNIYTRVNKILLIVLFGMFIAISVVVTFIFSFAIEDSFSMYYHSKIFLMSEAMRSAVVTFIMYAFSAATIKRTEYGHSLLESLLGLKNFINEAEMDKLRQMIDDNPEYFYNILPYAIVLGLEKKWAGKMEGITVSPPKYYRTSSGMPVSSAIATSSLLRCITRAGYTMSSGNSQGGSGGGFSGGGAGGGGGGSW